MAEGDSQSFRLKPSGIALALIVAVIGLIVFADGFRRGFPGWFPEIALGTIILGYGLAYATVPLYLTTVEGLVIKRGGFRGTDKVIRWSSVRDMQRVGDEVLALRVLDNSIVRVKVGYLTESGREGLISEIGRRTGHGEPALPADSGSR